MKTIICHTNEYSQFRRAIPKHCRISKYKAQAARSRVKEMLKKLPVEMIDDCLPKIVSVDYYA